MMIKKILSMVLTLCMVLGFIPVVTLPAGASGTERTTTLDLTSAATSSNASECWSWNAETKTLTLSGVNIHIPDGADSSCGIELPDGSTITLADLSVNTVTAGNVTAASSRSSIGIRFKCTSGALNRVNGSGTLSVTGGEVQEKNSTSIGIQTTNSGPLIIEGGTIHAYSSGAGWSSLALAVEKKLEISGGTVTARSGPAKYSFGISASNDALSISGGTVEAVGGSATDNSYGMQSSKNINISGGTVTATGGAVTGGSGSSIGVTAYHDVAISGGDVSATGISYGILAGGTCTLSGGTTITTPTDAGLSNDKKFIATALNGTTPVTAVHVMVPDVTAPTAPTAVTVTPIGGTVVTNVLNGTNTNMTATATIVAAAATGGKAELYVSGVLKCTDNTILATDTQVTFDLGLSSTLGLQAAIATGGEVTVKLYDAAGNNTTSSVGNPTLTVDYSGSALIGTASVTGFTAPVIGAVPQAVGALTAGAASYTVTSLTWSPVHSPYAATTAYTATVVLTSAAGYKFPTAGIAAPTADGGGTVSAGVTSGGDVSGNQLTFTVLFPATSTASSSNAELTSVAGQSAAPSGGNGSTVGTPITWSINVANGVSTVSLSDIAAAANATKILYSDSGFSTPASIALTEGGALTAYIKVTAQDTTTVKYYAVTISRAAAPSGGGSATTTPTKVVEVNGQKQDAGTSSTATSGGQTVTTIKVDATKLDKILESSGEKPTVTLPSTGSSVTVGELNGQTVKNMEKKEAVLEIKTANVSYTLPAAEINIDDVSSQLGSQVALKDIKVSVSIAEPTSDTVKVVQDTANKNSYQLVVKPVEFEITCTSGKKTVTVSKFNGYVERKVAIPDDIDPSKITTGIVLNSNGTFSHVPTQIVKIDGKYFAKINSLTNSTYSVIYNPVSFADVANHWAKAAINDMGSRMVVTGVGSSTYEPDRSITRAEFAAVVVRALGLQKGTTESTFGDVSLTDWFNGYVDTATAYSLITGYNSTSYCPNDTITREQAMAILARAMNLTGLIVSLTDSEASALLENYTDGAAVSNYAKSSTAMCIKTGVVSGSSATTLSPKAYVTRAEVAVMVQRLLQKSELI